MKTIQIFLTLGFCLSMLSKGMYAQQVIDAKVQMDLRQQHIITISSFTAKGDLESLNKALDKGLDGGLTINEIKEVLVHLYAYCGFPRSLQGINTFMAVLEDRKAKGIIDQQGKEVSPVQDNLSKYERGKRTLETLTGQPANLPKTGYAVFSPEIEVFLKEHLFADLFSRDVISYSDREIATISALVNLGGVEPMLQSHFRLALNIGITEAQLDQLLSIVEIQIGREEANAGRKVLAVITNKTQSIKTDNYKNTWNAKGVIAPANNFTGTVWVNTLVTGKDSLDVGIGTVTFDPGARSNWHKHPGGQVLLVTDGKGYFQERGKAIQVMQKGDIVICPPGVEHWHGATPDNKITHIAIATNSERGPVLWLEKVTENEYNKK